MKDGELDHQLHKDVNEGQVIQSFIGQLSSTEHDAAAGANIENVIAIIARLSTADNVVRALAQNVDALKTLLHHLAAGITKDSLKENILRIIVNCASSADDTCSIAITRLRGHKAACTAMQQALQQSSVKSYRNGSGVNSKKLGIRRLAASALRAMSQHQKCRLTMSEDDTVKIMVDVLEKSDDDHDLQARYSLLPASPCPNLPSFLVPARTCLRFAERAC